MINKRGPTCALFHEQPATLFCHTQGCCLPAFGCREQCFDKHDEHDKSQWSLIQKVILKISQLGVESKEIQVLEYQDKQLRILVEQLKVIQENNFKNVSSLRSRQTLNKFANKVVVAIKNKKTEQVTGHDMFNLFKEIKSDQLIINDKIIEQNIALTNNAVTWFVNNMKYLIEETKKQMAIAQFVKTDYRIDMSPPDSHIIKIKKIQKNAFDFYVEGASKQKNQDRYYPVYLSSPLRDMSYFEVKIVKRMQHVYIGVGVPDKFQSQNKRNPYTVLYYTSGKLFYGQNCLLDAAEELNSQSVVAVRRNKKNIQWFVNGNMECYFELPNQLLDKELFPVFRLKRCKGKSVLRLI